MRSILSFVLAIYLCGCPKEPNVTRADNWCDTSCAKLRSFRCSEGQSIHCVDLCREIVTSGYLDIDFECIQSAKDADELRVCGVCNP